MLGNFNISYDNTSTSVINFCNYYIDWLYRGYTPQVGRLRETNTGNRGSRAHASSIQSGFQSFSNQGLQDLKHTGKVKLDIYSRVLYEKSVADVGFVGIYDITRELVYLHPLTPFWRDSDSDANLPIDGNVEFNWDDIDHDPTMLEAFKRSIIHKAGAGASHAQIASLYGIADARWKWEVVGFRIIKRADHIEFSAQSQTMHHFKFQYKNKVKRSIRNGDDHYLTKEWSAALMTFLDRELP